MKLGASEEGAKREEQGQKTETDRGGEDCRHN